jgi:hypothetical protein
MFQLNRTTEWYADKNVSMKKEQFANLKSSLSLPVLKTNVLLSNLLFRMQLIVKFNI